MWNSITAHKKRNNTYLHIYNHSHGYKHAQYQLPTLNCIIIKPTHMTKITKHLFIMSL